MDELTNEELVLYAAGGCDRARNLMMEKNEGLVVSKAKIYWEGIYSSGMDKSLTQDDFIQLARIELWKAIDKFKLIFPGCERKTWSVQRVSCL